MAAKVYVGVSNVAKKVKKIYIGVDGKARKVKKAYIGVDGKARLFWQEQNPSTVAYSKTLTNSLPSMCSNGVSVGDYVVFIGGLSGTGSSAYAINTYCTYNSSLSQNTGRALAGTYGTVWALGVNNGKEACYLNTSTYSYYDVFGSSLGYMKRVNASLTASETQTDNYVCTSAVVAHKGSILQYGGRAYTNGSNDYGTNHGSVIYRYNENYTKSSISVNNPNGIYEVDGPAASIGNYAIIGEVRDATRYAFTVNQSFTVGTKLSFSATIFNGGVTDQYAVFPTGGTQIVCINTSLTISYKDITYPINRSSWCRNRPFLKFGDSAITPNMAVNSVSSTSSTNWLVINNSLTSRHFARTSVSTNSSIPDNRSNIPYGAVGSYIVRGGPETNGVYTKIEVLQS